jgi:DNA-binding MarR family transcriptional regulator
MERAPRPNPPPAGARARATRAPAPAPAPAPAETLVSPADPPFLDTHLVYLLARASQALWRGFEPAVRAAGLSSLEWRVLAVLAGAGRGLAVGELAAEVLAQQPTVTKLLDRLVAEGLCERRADPADARRTRVAITRAGRRRAAPLIAAARRHEAAALAALSLPDREARRLRSTLRRLFEPGEAA